MKFIEMFAGIGGFRLGLERQGHECVWANEWLEKPRGIYEYNFKEKPDDRDIRTISGEDVPRADLIVGGFPCATFSIAGKRTGFSLDDTRGTLCFEMFKIAKQQSIPYIMFENVKGLLNHDSGRTFAVILSALDEMGYDSQWELLDSQHFGVPQHRERIFLIANLRGQPRPKVFPITGKVQETSEPKVNQKNLIDIINKKGNSKNKNMASTISGGAHSGGNHSDMDLLIVPVITPDREKKRQNGRRFKEPGDPSYTLTGQDIHGVMLTEITKGQSQANRIYDSSGLATTLASQGGGLGAKTGLYKVDKPKILDASHRNEGNGIRIRRFTPLECERLQGLPDNFTKYRIKDGEVIENSDNERYERCGRTVTIPVIEAIGKKLGREWYD